MIVFNASLYSHQKLWTSLLFLLVWRVRGSRSNATIVDGSGGSFVWQPFCSLPLPCALLSFQRIQLNCYWQHRSTCPVRLHLLLSVTTSAKHCQLHPFCMIPDANYSPNRTFTNATYCCIRRLQHFYSSSSGVET